MKVRGTGGPAGPNRRWRIRRGSEKVVKFGYISEGGR